MNAVYRLHNYTDTWRGTNRLHDPQTNLPDDSECAATMESILGGLFLRLDYRRAYHGTRTRSCSRWIEFHDKLAAMEVEEAVDRLEKRISNQYPDIKHIYIEAGAVSVGGRESFAPWRSTLVDTVDLQQ